MLRRTVTPKTPQLPDRTMQVKTFIIRYLNTTTSSHTITTNNLAHLFIFRLYKRRPLPNEAQLIENISKSIGKQLSDLSEKYPKNIIKVARGKYTIKPKRV